MTRDLDAKIARLASRQHNVFAREQARAIGFTPSRINRRLACQRWTHEAPGVYGIAGGVPTWNRRLMTAHLDLGPPSVLSHRSAAVLHQFPGFRPGAPELTVPSGATRSPRWRVHEGDIPAGDRRRIDHVPVTNVIRTVLDVAAVVDRSRLTSLVEALLTERRVELGPLTARAEAHRRPGRPGSAALACLLAELGPGYIPSASKLEARLFAVLRAAGLPDPVRQHPLPPHRQRTRGRRLSLCPPHHRGRRPAPARSLRRLRPGPPARHRGRPPRLAHHPVHVGPTWSTGRSGSTTSSPGTSRLPPRALPTYKSA